MFLDTSGLLCYFHLNERQNTLAQTYFEAAGTKHTHNYVLVEFVALATVRGVPRPSLLNFIEAFLGSGSV